MEREDFIDTKWGDRLIIAMKGLPCTGKTSIATHICQWAKLPLFCVEDFIGASDNSTDTADSWEEAQRLHLTVLEQAFTTLHRVAERQIDTEFKCVVIKSRLSSTFELERLFQLVRGGLRVTRTLLVVECRVRNKHQWQKRFNKPYYRKLTWYRPRRWNDIEKARDDDSQALADWDANLVDLIRRYESNHRPTVFVRRLVLDPFYDLDLEILTGTSDAFNPIFAHAINHLLSASPEELSHQNPYVVEFDEFRRSRAREVLNALTSSTRSRDLCGAHGCLFKYREELQGVEVEGNNFCRVCEEKLNSGQPGYTCHYCILTLHKSCAELIRFSYRSITIEYSSLHYYIPGLPASEKHACDSHLQGFDDDCGSCLFQTVLKGRMLPAVVNHDHHPHPLSLRVQNKHYVCKACGVDAYNCSYVCRICEWYYHIQCDFMPKQVKHEHGGHPHLLKLKYTQDDMEQEDYWCDACFQDLDPYFWFYSCQSCPYYAAHLYCARVYHRHLWQIR